MRPNNSARVSRAAARGSSRPLLLAAVFFLLGSGATGVWYYHHQAGRATGDLSAPVQSLLGQVPAPVTVRYYSLLPAGSADSSLHAFSDRVATLLDAIQNASGGKVEISTVDTPNDTNTAAANADGIQPFNLDKGDACFLGLTITGGKNKEVLTHLDPEWEPALQYDVARSIQRVSAVPPPPKPAPEVAKPSPEIITSIQKLVPDINGTSIEDASKIFHADYVNQCAAAGQELEAEVNAASEQVAKAQSSGSDTDLEAARAHLQQIQIAQGEKLKAIAARLQTELAVFQQMKNATNASK